MSFDQKLNDIHNMFNTPSVCRHQNRVILEQYSGTTDFVLTLDDKNCTTLVPIKAGSPTSLLQAEQRFYFLLRKKTSGLTITEIKYDYAKDLVSARPELNADDIASSVEGVLSNFLIEQSLPKINKRDPDNWRIFLEVFTNQNNDVMKFFMSLAICKYGNQLKKL